MHTVCRALRAAARPSFSVFGRPSSSIPSSFRPSAFPSRQYSSASTHESHDSVAEEFKPINNADYPELLVGPFGHKDKPVIVPAYEAERIVGCLGPDAQSEHRLLWHWVRKGQPTMCLECGQTFVLKQLQDDHAHDEHDAHGHDAHGHDAHGHEHESGHEHGHEHETPESQQQHTLEKNHLLRQTAFLQNVRDLGQKFPALKQSLNDFFNGSVATLPSVPEAASQLEKLSKDREELLKEESELENGSRLSILRTARLFKYTPVAVEKLAAEYGLNKKEGASAHDSHHHHH